MTLGALGALGALWPEEDVGLVIDVGRPGAMFLPAAQTHRWPAP